LLERARDQFLLDPSVHGESPIMLAEMTLRSLTGSSEPAHDDFLARADILRALGFDVLISRFQHNYQVAEYLVGFTDRLIGFAVGLPTIREITGDAYYSDSPGGLIESAGRLFKRSVKVYVYPTRDPVTGQIQTLDTDTPSASWQRQLHSLLIDIGRMEPIRKYNESFLSIRTPDVLARIVNDDPSWETMVPPAVAETIKTKRLFRQLRKQ